MPRNKREFQIVPVGEGRFAIALRVNIFRVKLLKIDDIHPGHGGSDCWPMQFSKADALKFIRFLNFCKHFSLVIHWRIMYRISEQLGIDFTYLKIPRFNRPLIRVPKSWANPSPALIN